MRREIVDPNWNWTKKYNIPAGVKIGDTVHLSGSASLDHDGNVVGEGDLYAQSTQTFLNIAEALDSVGATMADVVKLTAYLTDVSNYAEFGKARNEAFPSGVPASTVVGTSGLVLPALLVEVDVIAAVGSGSS